MYKDAEVKKFHPQLQTMARQMIENRPRGVVVAKFHGEPVYLPRPRPEERRVGGGQFTQRQLDHLAELEQQRIEEILRSQNRMLW